MQENTQEYEVITIPVSDGTEKEFAIMNIFTVDDKQYIAVSLVEGEVIKDGVYLYRYSEAEDGDVITEQISLPSEYNKVSKVYEML